jgi:hypothetical protein
VLLKEGKALPAWQAPGAGAKKQIANLFWNSYFFSNMAMGLPTGPPLKVTVNLAKTGLKCENQCRLPRFPNPPILPKSLTLILPGALRRPTSFVSASVH